MIKETGKMSELISIMQLNEGVHEVRFLPFANDPQNSVATKEIFRDFQGTCTKEEHMLWKSMGCTQSIRIIRNQCYAILDNVPCRIVFGGSFQKAITCLGNGVAYFNIDGELSPYDGDRKINFDRPINPFNLSENVSVKFTVDKKGPYTRLSRFEFIFDEKNVIYNKETDDKAVILQKIKDLQDVDLKEWLK